MLQTHFEDDEKLELFLDDNDQLETGTKALYILDITKYCLCNDITPTHAIKEAIQEEQDGVHKGDRKIKRYFVKFKKCMLKEKLSFTTMQRAITNVKSFYRHSDVEIPHMKKLQRPDYDEEPSDDAEEGLPSKDMLQEALDFASPLWKAVITLMSSSGMGASEVVSLTYGDWLDALTCTHLTPEERKEQAHYLNIKNIPKENLFDMAHMDDIIRKQTIVPVFSVTRKKTSFKYKTFCTHEAVKEVSSYLRHRQINGLGVKSMNDPLFVVKLRGRKKPVIRPLNTDDFGNFFQRSRGKFYNNDGFKKNGRCHIWRSHSLRRYAGSNIYSYTELDFFQSEWLLGHKRREQDRTYYNKHTGELRAKYMSGLGKLCINWNEKDRATAQEYMRLKEAQLDNHQRINELEAKILKYERQADEHGLVHFKKM